MVFIYSFDYNVIGYICFCGQIDWLNNEFMVYSVIIVFLVFINIILLMIIYCLIGKVIFKQICLKKCRNLSVKRRMGRINMDIISFDVEFMNGILKNVQSDDVFEYFEWILDR